MAQPTRHSNVASAASSSSSSSSSSRPTSAARSTRSIKSARQERLLDHLVATFQDNDTGTPLPQNQRSLLRQNLEKQIWTPADRWEVDRHIEGLSRRHAIDLSYELSTAVKKTFQQLKLSARQSLDLTQKARELRLLHQREDERLLDNSGRARTASSRAKRKDDNDAIFNEPPITPDSVADVVQLLISLSRPANVTTSTYAHLLLDPDRPKRTTYLDPKQRQAVERAEWNRILREEPLEGDEWRSASSDTSDLSAWSASSHSAGRRASISDDDDERFLDAVPARDFHAPQIEAVGANDEEWQTQRDHRARALEETCLRQYHEAAASNRIDDLPDIVVIREAILALQGLGGLIFDLVSPTEIRLRSSLVSGSVHNGQTTKVEQLAAIASISSTLLKLQAFGEIYASGRTSRVTNDGRASIPLEAFAEQITVILERARTYFSEYDCDLAAGLMATTSSFQVRSRDATLSVLLAEVKRETHSLGSVAELLADLDMLNHPAERTLKPHGVNADCALLNGLQAMLTFDLAAGGRGSLMLRTDLSRCFLAMAQPWWRQVCRHIHEGVDLSTSAVQDYGRSASASAAARSAGLFERDRRLSPLDARFWQEGHRLAGQQGRERESGETIPAFLTPFAQDLLDISKSVGLLRALGAELSVSLQPCEELRTVLFGQRSEEAIRTGGDDDDAHSVEAGEDLVVETVDRLTMKRLTHSEATAIVNGALFNVGATGNTPTKPSLYGHNTRPPSLNTPWLTTMSPSTDSLSESLLEPHLSKTLASHLQPMLTLIRKRLHDALVSPWYEGGCDLYAHLSAIQGLFLMVRGAELSEWCDIIFDKLDSSPTTGSVGVNAYFLNSTFRDTIGDTDDVWTWIDTRSVRFTVRDPRSVSSNTSVRQLGDISVTYQVPWPISYFFTPKTLRAYQDVFTLLLQVQRARKKVANLLKASHADQHLAGLRRFWSLRRRVEWLVKVLGEYLIRDVINSSTHHLRLSMDTLITFNSLIEHHDKAMERIRYLCFLQPDQASLLDHVLDVLDLAMSISLTYVDTFRDESTGERGELKERDRAVRRRKARAKRPHRRRAQSDSDDDAEEVDNTEDGPEGQEAVNRNSSINADASSQSFTMDDTDTRHGHETFSSKLETYDAKLRILLDSLKTGVDEQIAKLAAAEAIRREGGCEDGKDGDDFGTSSYEVRERWQELLYALEEGR